MNARLNLVPNPVYFFRREFRIPLRQLVDGLFENDVHIALKQVLPPPCTFHAALRDDSLRKRSRGIDPVDPFSYVLGALVNGGMPRIKDKGPRRVPSNWVDVV